MLRLRITLLLLVLLPKSLRAQATATRYHLHQVISLESAYQEYLRDVATQLDSLQGRASHDSLCTVNRVGGYSCIVERGPVEARRRFVVPLPTTLPYARDLTDSFREIGVLFLNPAFRISWAPVSQALFGADSVRHWLAMARGDSIFGCLGSQCVELVYSSNLVLSPNDSQRTTDVIDECLVYRVRDVVGAPSNCVPALIVSARLTVVPVVLSVDDSYHAEAKKSPPIGFLVDSYRLFPLLHSESVVLAAMSRAFAGKPLSLETQVEDADTPLPVIVGTANYRASPILPNWREMVTVLAIVAHGSDEEPSTHDQVFTIFIRASAALFVNKQNTSRPGDWHQPDPQQQEVYFSAIRESVRRQLESLCKRPAWLDSRTLTCRP